MSWANPLTDILESPNPPAWPATYTEGVFTNVAVTSCAPIFFWISAALTVETATGVLLVFAKSIIPVPTTTTSSKVFASSTNWIVPKLLLEEENEKL